ncbi:uncharacterized protein EV420DRAFT_1747521 [Desarmillaria tabescens]|uniref:Homeobox domain-containing protein n=1 Tax=Armillaria tabescens TaxID=1929756 RepID=A0AA39N6J1_ARMTA|nr:uncharacterized protein EV420DRAFT_1747521 [Desarmillaria tabescens]KAK0459140.1 hypothetical protein EV420DRAFT_1747521 [Desarmillaria tabescens]
MPAEPLNERQVAFLERQLNWCRMLGMERPPKRDSIMISMQVSDLGRVVSSQEVGRWFSNRAKDASGKPRQSKKTPAQLAALRASFAVDCTPSVEEQIRLIEETGLTRRQIVAWFSYQRRKLEDEYGTYQECPADQETFTLGSHAHQAAAQWREYRAAGGQGAD